ncbi:N-acetylmuramoyl-L-alanine amidase-like domain-containing protein [Legionella sp. W05-934-2]|jgi:hypothetical protein|uniref:N-acetylmuramoyl-L-alanine amidase-like domain-containing protein n=1 Tax=Legionella sp. W05-934-2 TaxID=1198649 RepID=UPI003461A79F
MRFSLLIINLIAVILPVYSQPVHPIEQKTETILEKLYHTDAFKQKQRIEARLQWLSNNYLSKPYILFPLGEGITGEYDQQPRYRLDGFDCETFVTTQLALALSNSPQSFKQCIDKMRYHGNTICYLRRNHFTSIDWNRSNQRLGLLQDITREIHGNNQQKLYKTAVGSIDKASWYQHISSDRIKLFETTRSEIKARMHALKNAGKVFKPQKAIVDYIPTESLLDKNDELNMKVVRQIPNGAIMEIVRPNWNLRDKIGTNLHISHLGFIFWHDNHPYFLHASSESKKVVKVPLKTYLHEMKKSPTIKGINLQVVPFSNINESPCIHLFKNE